MTTNVAGQQVIPRQSPATPELRAADQGVADALESVLAGNTRRVYGDPVAHLRGLVRRGRAHISPRRAPHRGPLPGRPRR